MMLKRGSIYTRLLAVLLAFVLAVPWSAMASAAGNARSVQEETAGTPENNTAVETGVKNDVKRSTTKSSGSTRSSIVKGSALIGSAASEEEAEIPVSGKGSANAGNVFSAADVMELAADQEITFPVTFYASREDKVQGKAPIKEFVDVRNGTRLSDLTEQLEDLNPENGWMVNEEVPLFGSYWKSARDPDCGVQAENYILKKTDEKKACRFIIYPTDEVTIRFYKDKNKESKIGEFTVPQGTDLLDLVAQLGDDYTYTDWMYPRTATMYSPLPAGESYKILSDMDICISITVRFCWSDPEEVNGEGNVLKIANMADYEATLSEVMNQNGSPGKGLDQANWEFRTKSGTQGTVKEEDFSEYQVKESMDLWLDFSEDDGQFSIAFFKKNPAEISMKNKNAVLNNLVYLFANQSQNVFSNWMSKLPDADPDMVWGDGNRNIAADEMISGNLNIWYGTHTVRFFWKNPEENGTGPDNWMTTENVQHGKKLWKDVIGAVYGVAWGQNYLDEKDWHVMSLDGKELAVLNEGNTKTDISVTQDMDVWVDAGLLVRICNDYPSSFEIKEAAGIVAASKGDQVAQIVKDWLGKQTGKYRLKDALFVTGSGKDAEDVHDLTDVDVVGDDDVVVWVKTFEVSVYDKDPTGTENPEEPLAMYPETKSYSTVEEVLKEFFEEHPEYSELSWNESLTALVHKDMKLWTEKEVALSYAGQSEVFYSSLQAALDAIPDDAENVTIRLLKDVELTEAVDSKSKVFKLDLDGHRFDTRSNKLVVDKFSEIALENGGIDGEVEVFGKLTVTGTAQADFGTLTVGDGAEVLLDVSVSAKKICLGEGCCVNAGAGFELTGEKTEICFLSNADVTKVNDGEKLTLIRAQDGAVLSEQIGQKITLSAGKNVTELSKEAVAVKDAETGELVAIRAAKKIYVNGSAGDDDKNSGFEPDKPVKTFARAKELLEQLQDVASDPGEIEGIYVTGTVEVTDSETWSLPKNTKLMRYEQKVSRETDKVSTFKGSLVNVTGALTLEDIVIDGSSVTDAAGALVDVKGGSLTIAGGAVLQNNFHRGQSSGGYPASGGAVYADNGTVTMTGGEITRNESWYGGGICLNGSTLTMTGGNIHGNWVHWEKGVNENPGGAGIAAAFGSTVKIQGGTISDNWSADVGGGISIGLPQENTVKKISRLNMTGGSVSGNFSDGRGGGIFIQSNCVGTISAGSITGNYCLDKAQFAGGGIYVNGNRKSVLTGVEYDAGALYLTNVKITGNTGAGSGGVAGCDTSTTNIYRINGGIIYDNDGAEVYIDNGLTYTQPRGTISEFGLNNTICNWTENGKPVASESNDHANRKCLQEVCRTLNLESAPDNAAAAAMAATVDISGNTASGGGGGIATNGYLQIGEPGGTSVTAKKLWDDAKNADKLRPEGIDDVKVWLLRDGKRVGYYNFSKNNDGTWPESLTIENLPEGNYTVEEELAGIVYHEDGTLENPNGADVLYEAFFGKDGDTFVVTNRLKKDLVISKTTAGYIPKEFSDATYSFRVKLNLPDGQEVQAELFSGKAQGKKFTGAVSGGILKIDGSTEIKLKSDERLLLKSLPADTGYEVSETDVPDGFTPSVKVREIQPDGKVSVRTDGKLDQTGSLMAEGKVGKAGSTTEVAFTNIYDAAGVWTPSGTKTLTGRDMEEGEFHFTVSEAGKIVSEGSNMAAGDGQAAAIMFAEIPYTLADTGTHTYVIAEELTDLPEGVIGDEHSYEVQVKVSDQGNGTLKAEAVYKLDSDNETSVQTGDGAAFINTYEAVGAWTPSGTKTLTGRDMAAGEFRFTVKEDGKTVSEGLNTAAGDGQAATITFTEISYTQADIGTHTYVIAEELTDLPERVTGDERVYTVQVEVSDQGDGTLTVDAVYTEGTKEYTFAEFENEYEQERKITVTVDKVNAQSGVSLAGAVLKVVAVDGSEIDKWTSDGTPHQITGELTPGATYRLIEVSAPEGYQLAAAVTFEAVDGLRIVMKDEPSPKSNLVISKTMTGYVPERLADASYSFRVKLDLADGMKVEAEMFSEKEDQSTKLIGKVTNGMLEIDGSTVIRLKAGDRLLLDSLPANTGYEVSEMNVPAGVTPSVKVTGGVSSQADGLKASGKIGEAGSTTEVAFTNTYSAVGIWTPSGTKTLTGRDMAEGEFRFTVREADRIVSQGVNAAAGNAQAAAITFTGIPYTLADVGTHTYVIAEELTNLPERVTGDARVYTVQVQVSDQGDGTLKADAVYMEGTREYVLAEFGNVYEEEREITVTVDKVNAQSGVSLAGAVLKVVAADGTEIDKWTSDGTPHQITGKLIPGATYQLIEVSAPAGYQIAADITFEAAEGGQIVMKDEEQPVVPNPGTVAVTKNLVLNGNPMGAEDQTFYVALYEDAACTKRVSDIRPLVFRRTSSTTVEFKGLPAGKVYYVGESDANGNVLQRGTVADGTVFAVNFQNGNTATTEEGKTTRVSFANEFYGIPHGFYREGELTITKKLLKADGTSRKSNEVFYAGIFADREYSVLSDQVSQNIVALDLGGKSETSVTVKVTLLEDQVQRLYVTETDENGVPVANSEFAYEVTVEDGEVSMDTDSTEASVMITNREQPDETETEKETEAQTEKETEKQTEKKKSAVKTGDNTPTALYFSLMVAALAVLLLQAFRRRRSR